jgi:hypothetical protein
MADLVAVSPEPAKFDVAERKIGHEIPDEVREKLTESYRKHQEKAWSAIGYFRLKELTEEEAIEDVEAARKEFRQDAAEVLSIPSEQVERIFRSAPAR